MYQYICVDVYTGVRSSVPFHMTLVQELTGTLGFSAAAGACAFVAWKLLGCSKVIVCVFLSVKSVHCFWEAFLVLPGWMELALHVTRQWR